jgi:predicted nucleotidyltransferase component of viral defense system
MTKGANLAASIRQRLLNKAKEQRRPFNELLQYYAMERFLYRLSQSIHADRFILKGALMLRVWQAPQARPTMDIDMLGRTANDPAAISAQVKDILTTEVVDDGIEFNTQSLQTETIKERSEYQGIRVRFNGQLSGARVAMQLDIGFGDALASGPIKAMYPTLLDLPAPELLCYSRETAIAEKLEAMVKLGELNSRMKDFYDIWLLARQFDFDRVTLLSAIQKTFQRRDTTLPTTLPFDDHFTELKQPQWQAFHKRLSSPQVPESFAAVLAALEDFFSPLLNKDEATTPAVASHWSAPGPWRPQQDG